MKNVYVVRSDELMHWGILGMKWGVRRYQNEDGSWTTLGKLRRNHEEAMNAKRDADHKYSDEELYDVNRWNKETAEDTMRVKNTANAAGKTVSGVQQMNSAIAKQFGKEYEGGDISQLSDNELRAIINRMQMERTYKEMTSHPSSTAVNLEKVNDCLSIVGGVVTTIGSIAFLINQFTK